jgi:hypothetical protein
MRGLVPAIHNIADEFKSHPVDILTVYILEAHATDEWPISSSRYSPTGSAVAFEQHKKLQDRIGAANKFVEDFNYRIPMCVDTMENQFEKEYAPWPIRFYIVEKLAENEPVKISLIAFPRNASYDISVIRKWLCKRFSVAFD